MKQKTWTGMRGLSIAMAIAVTNAIFASDTSADIHRWTSQLVPPPPGVSSIVALGASKDGAIVAQGIAAGLPRAYVYLLAPRNGLSSGWNDLGQSAHRSFPGQTLSPSVGAFAGIILGEQAPEFILALAQNFESCGVGLSVSLPQGTSGWATALMDSGEVVAIC